MDEQYLTLVTALLAAALGSGIALLTAFLTNRANTARLKMEQTHQAQRRKSELLRERGEELYALTDKWLKGLTANYLGKSFVMQGKLTFDQYYNQMLKSVEKDTFNFGRIEMLIDVYFPLARAQYDAVIERRGELNKIDVEHKHAYESGDIPGTQFLKPYVRVQHSIEETGESLKKKIIECIQAVG